MQIEEYSAPTKFPRRDVAGRHDRNGDPVAVTAQVGQLAIIGRKLAQAV